MVITGSISAVTSHEGANLDKCEELVDLYGGAEIDGYQLDRLQDELRAASQDAQAKPEQWRVLTGWEESQGRDNEIWRDVEKSKLLATIDQLLWLIDFAKERHLKLIVSGD